MTDDAPHAPPPAASSAPEAVAPIGERIVFALRQGAILGFALLVAGLVTERLRPDEAFDRGIASTPFLWAIVVWFAVLIFSAIAFDEPQTQVLEAKPLFGAGVIGAFVFVTGLVTLDDGSFGRRLVYLVATSLGAVMFWWAVISLGYVVARRLR